uniref:Phytase n=1 Tax=virus sp. ct5rm7 TaxID=2827298 RepID=A0A8S5RGR0_9VIRU|nr:MAG TPA: Phytase [virus sp. ct5rm7]
MRKNIFTNLCFLAFSLLLLTGCEEDEISAVNSEDGNTSDNELCVKLTPADYDSDNTYYLLNDDEPSEVYFNNSQRSFYVNAPLQLTLDDDHYFQLRFYSPRKLSNVTIWAKIDGYEEAFRFMELEEIRPFQQLRIHIPFATKDLIAYTRSGKKIQIMANPYLTGENLTFEVESDDPYYKKLQSIRCKWRITFSGYSGAGSWQYKLLPPHTREAVALALNMSYMFSSETFETALQEFGPLHSDNNKTLIDKDALLKKVFNHSGLCFGHCSGVNGLGGGGTYGLNEWCYLEHYADDKFETHTVFHELAHCFGYSHNGNMTYEQTGPGWITLCANVYLSMSLDKELPVYSRRFMHTRANKNRYGKDMIQASKYIIEDPELDEIDGGLSPLRGETDLGGNEGKPFSFKLDYTALPGATAATFRPKDVYVYGDTLYVVNDADNNYSLEVFSMAEGNIAHLGSIKEWTEQNTTNSFVGRPNGVVRANDKIYVTHEGSRTEIFDAKDHRFITCIGNGKWGTGNTQTVHAFDVVLYKGAVMIRDKRYVDFVQEQTVFPGETMLIFARSENLGEVSGTYGMAVDEQTGLLYSTHPSKRIDILAPAEVREGTTLKRARQLTYKNNPYALDFYEGRMFVSSNGREKLCDVNPETGDIIKDYTVVGGITLQAPEKFCIRRNTLFITDRINNGACIYAIPMSELK